MDIVLPVEGGVAGSVLLKKWGGAGSADMLLEEGGGAGSAGDVAVGLSEAGGGAGAAGGNDDNALTSSVGVAVGVVLK